MVPQSVLYIQSEFGDETGHFGGHEGVVRVEVGLQSAYLNQHCCYLLHVFHLQLQDALCSLEVVLGVHQADEDVAFGFSHQMERFGQLEKSVFLLHHLIDLLLVIAVLIVVYMLVELVVALPPVGSAELFVSDIHQSLE